MSATALATVIVQGIFKLLNRSTCKSKSKCMECQTTPEAQEATASPVVFETSKRSMNGSVTTTKVYIADKESEDGDE